METATQSKTILFADITGSTRLYETLGDAEAQATIARCLEIIRVACDRHGGRVIKTIGDGSMAVFEQPSEAASAAIAMHTEISMQRTPQGGALSIHVGFHHGPILAGEMDAHGDTVNVAARLSELAKSGQTLLSAATADALSPALRARTRPQDAETVKGKQADMALCELLWQDSLEELTMLSMPRAARRAYLQLTYNGRARVLDESSGVVIVGRDASSDLIVENRMASRLHARIERRRGNFVLVDVSSNGTYCTMEGDPEIVLLREELILRGRGRVSFGLPSAQDPLRCLEFSCRD